MFFSCRFCLSKIGKLGHSHFQVQINNVDRLYHALFSLLHLLLAWSIQVLNIFFCPNLLVFGGCPSVRGSSYCIIPLYHSTNQPLNHSTTPSIHPPTHPSIHPSACFSTSAFDTLRCSPWFARQSFCHCLHTAETQNFTRVFSYQITEGNFKTCTLRPCNLKKSKPKTQTQKPKTLQFLKAWAWKTKDIKKPNRTQCFPQEIGFFRYVDNLHRIFISWYRENQGVAHSAHPFPAQAATKSGGWALGKRGSGNRPFWPPGGVLGKLPVLRPKKKSKNPKAMVPTEPHLSQSFVGNCLVTIVVRSENDP